MDGDARGSPKPPNWVFFPDVATVEKMKSTSEATWPGDLISFSKHVVASPRDPHTIFWGVKTRSRRSGGAQDGRASRVPVKTLEKTQLLHKLKQTGALKKRRKAVISQILQLQRRSRCG